MAKSGFLESSPCAANYPPERLPNDVSGSQLFDSFFYILYFSVTDSHAFEENSSLLKLLIHHNKTH